MASADGTGRRTTAPGRSQGSARPYSPPQMVLRGATRRLCADAREMTATTITGCRRDQERPRLRQLQPGRPVGHEVPRHHRRRHHPGDTGPGRTSRSSSTSTTTGLPTMASAYKTTPRPTAPGRSPGSVATVLGTTRCFEELLRRLRPDGGRPTAMPSSGRRDADQRASTSPTSTSVDLSGTKYLDTTGDGITRATPAGRRHGLRRPQRQRSDDDEATATTTAADGTWSFTGLGSRCSATWCSEELPDGYVQTVGDRRL